MVDLEEKLIGRPATPKTFATITADDISTLTPIDDVRAPASYRLDAAAELARRAFVGCLPAEERR
jgi:CO/xanthine dehydrogenase FAD-binding subunit